MNEYVINLSYDRDSLLSELRRALNCLNQSFKNSKNEPALIIENKHNIQVIKSILTCVSSHIFQTEVEEYDGIFEATDGYDKLISILKFLTSIVDQLDFNLNLAVLTQSHDELNLDEKRLLVLHSIVKIINFLLIRSIKLRNYLLEKERLEYFFILIKNINLITSNNSTMLLSSILNDINWLSKAAEINKKDWKEIKAIPALLGVLNVASCYKRAIFMAVANIADDNQIESITEIQESIDHFIELANKGAKYYKTNTKVNLVQQQFTDEGGDENEKPLVFNVLSILDEDLNSLTTITGILLAIYRLSINPKAKLNIYNKKNFKKSLKIFLKHGNEIEKQYSMQVIAQLAFDSEVIKQIIDDHELCEMINNINRNENIQLKKLKNICKQIIWLIDENKSKSVQPKFNHSTNENHIMISYNTGSRDLCLKIKEDLEKENYKIWIDVAEIAGSSLDSMAKAVESSSVILMCVNEKYRQSLNCQAEAQYSFRLKKKIIPCIFQQGYHNVDGWLGFIIGDKIFVDFFKYSYEEAFKRLKIQITLLTKSEATVTKLAEKEIQNTNIIVSKKIETWSESEVEEWFIENKMNSTFIFEQLLPCNGELLAQLYSILSSSPEFFLKSLSQNDLNIKNLKIIAEFSGKLKKLFN